MPIPRLGQVELGVFHLHAGLRTSTSLTSWHCEVAAALRSCSSTPSSCSLTSMVFWPARLVVTHAHVVDHAPPLGLPGVPRLLDLVAGHGKTQSPLAAGDDLLRHSPAGALGPIVADFIRDVFEGGWGTARPGDATLPRRGLPFELGPGWGWTRWRSAPDPPGSAGPSRAHARAAGEPPLFLRRRTENQEGDQ